LDLDEQKDWALVEYGGSSETAPDYKEDDEAEVYNTSDLTEDGENIIADDNDAAIDIPKDNEDGADQDGDLVEYGGSSETVVTGATEDDKNDQVDSYETAEIQGRSRVSEGVMKKKYF
jgi:hypothetical protein